MFSFLGSGNSGVTTPKRAGTMLQAASLPSSTSSSGVTAPKRTSTILKAAPLPSKLTTATSPTDYDVVAPSFTTPPSSYPPPGTKSSASSSYDAQWEHVNKGPSPSSDADSDMAMFERLSFSQADGDGPRGAGAPRPLPSSPPVRASAKWHEERDQLRQQLDAALGAQRKAETDRDRWERKVMELRSSQRLEREREKDRDKEKTDALKVESERLKKMLEQHTRQLETAREEIKKERMQRQSETEKLEGALNAARGVYKEEVDTLKAGLQEHVQRVEYLTVDRERMRQERESLKGSLSGEIGHLKITHAKEVERLKSAVDEVNQDRLQAHSDLRKARISLDSCVPKLEDSIREADALRRELSGAKESSRMATELKQRLDIQTKALQNAREESSALKREFLQLTTLLEDRTSELKGAQSFLTTADAFSGVEVTSTLQRLNAEVLQSTAFMAESMVELFFHETTSQVSKTDEQLAACKRASLAIGGAIVHFLGTKKHRDDPILIQIAFQAYLTYRLRWVACAWIIGGDEDHNRFIDAIYHSVREREAQAIAGRWRALTRAHVPSTPFDESQIAFQISTKIISGLSDILLATGCTAPKADIGAALTSKFSEKLSFLVSLAMRVNKIVGEEVTSGDLEVLAVPPGTAFDLITMEDSYDDGGSARAKGNVPKVLSATDLGLRKKTRVATTGEKQWETKVLLKPKVALESVIDILDE